MQTGREHSSGLPRQEMQVTSPSEGRQSRALSEEQELIEVDDLKSFLESLEGCPLILRLVEATLTPEQKKQYSNTLRKLRQNNLRQKKK